MIVKDRVYQECKSCGSRKLVAEDVYGCDLCKKEMDMISGNRLDVQIFHNGSEATEHKHFCSWQCVLEFIPAITTDYFVTLPYLQYDDDTPKGQRAKDFLALISRSTNAKQTK